MQVLKGLLLFAICFLSPKPHGLCSLESCWSFQLKTYRASALNKALTSHLWKIYISHKHNFGLTSPTEESISTGRATLIFIKALHWETQWKTCLWTCNWSLPIIFPPPKTLLFSLVVKLPSFLCHILFSGVWAAQQSPHLSPRQERLLPSSSLHIPGGWAELSPLAHCYSWVCQSLPHSFFFPLFWN